MCVEKLDYCYHTHTSRCGHAFGDDEEYVISAIKLGIKRLGFSDHVFLPGIDQPGMRGDITLLDDYLCSINYLKDKYKDKIEILVGFEAEYSEHFLDYYKKLLDSKKIDYLILGQHQYYEDNDMKRYFYKGYDKECAYHYAEDVIKGIESGLFKYLCHPDLFINFYGIWDEAMIDCARKILSACEKHHVPIELNIGGMRPEYYYSLNCYPSDTFFLIAKDYDVDIVIGIDAHDPKDFNLKDVNRALEFANKHELRVIDYVMKKD